jgi:hypothetical protein
LDIADQMTEMQWTVGIGKGGGNQSWCDIHA